MVNGKNIGCRFPYLKSSDYKDFYICVNGSSESQSIRSSYFIFQLQNKGEVNNFNSLGHLQPHGREEIQIHIDTCGKAKPEKGRLTGQSI